MKLICCNERCYTFQHRPTHGVMILSIILHMGAIQVIWMLEINEH